jgi:hypothetical protein
MSDVDAVTDFRERGFGDVEEIQTRFLRAAGKTFNDIRRHRVSRPPQLLPSSNFSNSGKCFSASRWSVMNRASARCHAISE